MAKNDSVPVEEIPEVAAFVDVQKRYEAFKESNPEFFEYLCSLAEEYNEKRTAAEKIVRGRGVSCGPFDKFQTQTKYDADAMYTMLGPEKFLQMGGQETTIKVRSLDKKMVEMHIQSGSLDPEVAAVITKVSPRYRSVEELKVL